METIEVNGTEIAIDRAKAASWDAFKLVRKMQDGDTMDKLDAAMEFASLVTGLSVEDIVGIAGGGSAPVEEVARVASEIIGAASPKN